MFKHNPVPSWSYILKMAHSTHKEVDLLSDAKRCYDTLPEEEKRGSKGKMLTSVINKLIAVRDAPLEM